MVSSMKEMRKDCSGVQGRFGKKGEKENSKPVLGSHGTKLCSILRPSKAAATPKPSKKSPRRLRTLPRPKRSPEVSASGIVSKGNERRSSRVHCRCTSVTKEKTPRNITMKKRLQQASGSSQTPQGMLLSGEPS